MRKSFRRLIWSMSTFCGKQLSPQRSDEFQGLVWCVSSIYNHRGSQSSVSERPGPCWVTEHHPEEEQLVIHKNPSLGSSALKLLIHPAQPAYEEWYRHLSTHWLIGQEMKNSSNPSCPSSFNQSKGPSLKMQSSTWPQQPRTSTLSPPPMVLLSLGTWGIAPGNPQISLH